MPSVDESVSPPSFLLLINVPFRSWKQKPEEEKPSGKMHFYFCLISHFKLALPRLTNEP